MTQVTFHRCKLTGIDFSPVMVLGIDFPDNKMVYCSFLRIKIPNSNFQDSQMEESLFAGSDLRKCNFSRVAFGGSRFEDCELNQADFSDSFDFVMDPQKNRLSDAKFSADNALILLKAFKVVIK